MVAVRSVAAMVVLLCVACAAHADVLKPRAQLHGFARPSAAFDAEGNIYVADRGNNRVVKYSANGDSLVSVSGSGWGDTQFDGPSAIVVRGVDVFVADYGNHRIQRFDRSLSFVASLSTRDNARESERFGYPRGLALSQQGDLFVLDGEGMRIVKITPFNQVERTFGSTEAGAERMVDPKSICVEARGMVDVADAGTVKQFDLFGTPRGMLPLMSPRWCASAENWLYVLTDEGLMRFGEGVDPTVFRLPPGAWTGAAVTHDRLALWNDSDVLVFEIHP